MNLSNLKPNTPRLSKKRIGRGGKRGTYSGKGSKGQKSRAGAAVKPGFRGGDNRLWQLFPKQRGASSKPGNARVHAKHRYYQLRHDKWPVINLGSLNSLSESESVTIETLVNKGFISGRPRGVKILGSGELKKKLNFEGKFEFSGSAKEKIEKAGGSIKA